MVDLMCLKELSKKLSTLDLIKSFFPYKFILFLPILATSLKMLFDSKIPIVPLLLNATGTLPKGLRIKISQFF